MSMLLTCDNLGCYRQDFHKLDAKTGQVICNECGKEIKSITTITKGLLKSSRQIIIDDRSENEMACEECGGYTPPVVKKLTDTSYEVCCGSCGAVNRHQSRFFGHAWVGRDGIKVEDCREMHRKKVDSLKAKMPPKQSSNEDDKVPEEWAGEVLTPATKAPEKPPLASELIKQAWDELS